MEPTNRRTDPTSIETREEFALLLHGLRASSGVSFRALAAIADIPATTISSWTSGKHLPYLRQEDAFRRVIDQLGATTDETDAWAAALRRLHLGASQQRTIQSSTPYRGLDRFEPGDAAWFFGRDALIDDVIERTHPLIERGTDRMMVVVGTSGAGKSSLLRAGVAARISSGALGPDWQLAIVEPGPRPLDALAHSLAPFTEVSHDDFASSLRLDPATAALGLGRQVALIVDQLEEVFTQCDDEAERAAFLEALTDLADAATPVMVYMSIRVDFYGALAQYPRFARTLEERQVLVSSMTADQLRSVITEPARLAGRTVDPELVAVLLRDFVPRNAAGGAHDAGALPLLSHALFETWARTKGTSLQLSDYLEVGGLDGAINQTAENAFAALAAHDQEIARRVFLRLVNIDDDGVTTRRRVPFDDLVDQSDAEEIDLETESVVRHFIDRRLLTAGESTVELSHEVLLSAWFRLREWVGQDREGLLVTQRLRDAARVWVQSGRDDGALLSGPRLDTALAWSTNERSQHQLASVERDFLAAGRRRATERANSARRRRRLFRALTGAAVAMAIITTITAVVAVDARETAERERNDALSRKVALQAIQLRETEPALAAQLALVAYRTSPTTDARSALLDLSALATPSRFLGGPGSVALAVSADLQTMAVSNAVTGEVQLFDLADGAPRRTITVPAPDGVGEYFALALSPDGSLLAAGGMNLGARIWRITTDGSELIADELGEFDSGVQTMAFNAAGDELIVGAQGSVMRRYSIADTGSPTELTPIGQTGLTKTVVWHPDMTMIAAGSADGSLTMWDAADGSELTRIEPVIEGEELHALAFNPEGTLLAAAYRGAAIRLFEVNGSTLTELEGPATSFTTWVNAIAFSADGTRLAAGGSDSRIDVWSVDEWQLQRSFRHPGPVTGIMFIDDDASLAAVSTDGAARIWPLTGSPLAGARANVFNLSFSTDGSTLAVFPGRQDGTLQLWDTSSIDNPTPLNLRVPMPEATGESSGSGALAPDGGAIVSGTRTGPAQVWAIVDPRSPEPAPTSLTGPTALIEMVAISPDSRVAAIGSDDSTIHMWDISDPLAAKPLPTLDDATNQVLGVTFNPDGTLFAASSADTFVYLWDYSDPEAPQLLARLEGFESYAQAVAFSDDGQLLAAGSADKTVRVWDISNPSEPTQIGEAITGPQNYVYAVDFQPNSRLLVGAVTDGTAWLWDLADPAAPDHIATLTSPEAALYIATFTPDGTRLAAAGSDQVVYFWDIDPDSIAGKLCDQVGDPITEEEWNLYLPEASYDPPCGP